MAKIFKIYYLLQYLKSETNLCMDPIRFTLISLVVCEKLLICINISTLWMAKILNISATIWSKTKVAFFRQKINRIWNHLYPQHIPAIFFATLPRSSLSSAFWTFLHNFPQFSALPTFPSDPRHPHKKSRKSLKHTPSSYPIHNIANLLIQGLIRDLAPFPSTSLPPYQ